MYCAYRPTGPTTRLRHRMAQTSSRSCSRGIDFLDSINHNTICESAAVSHLGRASGVFPFVCVPARASLVVVYLSDL